MHFINGIVCSGDFRFRRGGFEVQNDRFFSVGEELEHYGEAAKKKCDVLDLDGNYVIPGLIDVHVHGGAGADFTEGDYGGLVTMAGWLCRNGVTSFSAAAITQSEEKLTRACCAGARLKRENPRGCARISGITMEGPFFSKEKRGAQPEQFLQEPDTRLVDRLSAAAEGLLKIVCVAPELPGAMELIEKLAPRYGISLGHTTAGYDTSRKAIQKGATQVTHLFNGMVPFHHREPGLIGAAAEDVRVSAELICDGVHVHESAIRAAFSLFGRERIILISDGLSACGGVEGAHYTSGGERITLRDGAAVLSDGVTLAGSTTPLLECVRRAIAFGIPPEDAVRAATANPARSIGTFFETGSIEAGKLADFLVCDGQFNLLQVYAAGRPVLPQRC